MPIPTGSNHNDEHNNINPNNPNIDSSLDSIASNTVSKNVPLSNLNEKFIRQDKINQKMKETLNNIT
ncbi:hypothetical protein [Oceanirhabdus sp. W0125-5]|uniref:hypothetical protein n=1 Tax=Oceanirhabdus sp. W0125-5 TaxID=2999116 RepID=UPI0022F32415|nr:hypothetical protein [Oceanirhabdus sp. W0125-5]WBW95585.1 hypothetical protein OW730_18070 [Oceanirhabdus sp. W0125-5]